MPLAWAQRRHSPAAELANWLLGMNVYYGTIYPLQLSKKLFYNFIYDNCYLEYKLFYIFFFLINFYRNFTLYYIF